MKITAIKQQQKRHDRYSIYVDGKYSFSLSENDLMARGLAKDQEFTAAKLQELQQTSIVGKAYDRALNYLSIRSRSRYELETYLQRKQYEQPVIEAALSRIEQAGFIDDAAFAKSWVEWRQATTSRSKRRLQAELAQKRIDRDIIEQALADITEDDQLAALQALVERKRSRYSDEQKLMAYLASQGYSYDLIKRALHDQY